MDTKPLKILLNTSLTVAGLPHLIYAVNRALGRVPSEAEWNAQVGGNHGPWWDSSFVLFVLFALLMLAVVLPLVTSVTAVVVSLRACQRRPFVYGALLVVGQFALAYLQGSLLWLVD